mmetsp:Transcript_124574/g.265675  ORF Transcript_124574/g.265675 Transcript_124574/m.265675 type:complete len:139 (+) Transcript_124574:1724-2140(+)
MEAEARVGEPLREEAADPDAETKPRLCPENEEERGRGGRPAAAIGTICRAAGAVSADGCEEAMPPLRQGEGLDRRDDPASTATPTSGRRKVGIELVAPVVHFSGLPAAPASTDPGMTLRRTCPHSPTGRALGVRCLHQ